MNQEPLTLTLPDRTLAYQQRNAVPAKQSAAGIFFLGGFASDMTGTKASFLDEYCARDGFGLTRFDYRGHGASSGRFEEGCLSDWFDDALTVLDRLCAGPQILVGSSMGGWIGLLLARARPERIAGFVGIAAAPDFTEDLIRPVLTPAQHAALARDGFFYEDDTPPDHRVPITKKLLDDGVSNLVLRDALTFDAPVRLIQGQQDAEVPWHTALRIAGHVSAQDVRVTLVKDGDHRLSRPQDLALIGEEVRALALRT